MSFGYPSNFSIHILANTDILDEFRPAFFVRVPKLRVRHLLGRVRPRTWRFEGFLDPTIIIF
jgi:hypothetical protein